MEKEKKGTFQVGNETLRFLSLSENGTQKYDIISLHGAGKSNKESILYLLKELVPKTHLNVFAFDFSGHGESTGMMTEQSLEKRAMQAKTALQNFGSNSPIIIGSSMGGDTTLRMLEYFNPKLLILFCPAIYTKQAYTIPFTDQFTKLLRESDSWKDSDDVLMLLEKYTGKLLIIIGTEDAVIPEGVIDLLDKHSKNTSKKEILRIPDCPHRIHLFLSEHVKERKIVDTKILDFIQD